VHVDGVGRERLSVVDPHVLCDLAAVGDRGRKTHQRLENAELGRGQRRAAATEADLPRGRVALKVADQQPGRQQVRWAALQGPQAGKQLLNVERHDKEVVRARVEPGHPVARRVLAADHQHRGGHATAAQQPDHLDAGHLGQQPVEHRNGVVVAATVAERQPTVRDQVRHVTLPGQPLRDHAAEGVVSRRHQHSHTGNVSSPVPLRHSRAAFIEN
jgi:hypothetical protein